jgi:hypothetical protein
VQPTVRTRLKECGHGCAFLVGEFVDCTTIIDATGQKCQLLHRPKANGCRHAVFIHSALFFFRPIPVHFILAFRSATLDESTFLSLIPLPFSSTSFTVFFPSLRLNMRSLFTLFSLVASACAYQIITPGNSNGWTTAGNNNVTWTRVSTDQTTFTMVLVNQVRSPPLTRSFPATWALFTGISGQDHLAIRPGNPHCDSRRLSRRNRCPRT